nr:polyphenol oxidase family protein [Propionibacterium sp.]
MFSYLRDPGADGVGVAFTSAEEDLSDAAPPAARAAAFGRLAVALGVPVAVVRQVHGDRVLDVDAVPAAPSGGLLDLTAVEADALVTGVRGLGLAVRVADCVPVLFADAAAGLVGAAHAGRAGLLRGVLAATVAVLRARGASRLTAWVGPHICAACYEVPADMAADFAAATGVAAAVTRWGTPGIDLGAAARRQLAALGVPHASHEACTFHDAGLHSHRRDAACAGRLAGVVWLSGSVPTRPGAPRAATGGGG